MGKIGSHRELVVWQRGIDLAVEVYRLAGRLPRSERFRISDQLTRAAASAPANIAEGSARSTAREYAHFLAIAKGSARETETFLLLAERLGYLPREELRPALRMIVQVSKMLTRLRSRLLASADRASPSLQPVTCNL